MKAWNEIVLFKNVFLPYILKNTQLVTYRGHGGKIHSHREPVLQGE